MPLTFSFAEVLSEIATIEKIASKYISRESANVLPNLHASLENVRTQRNNAVVEWGIPADAPLRTSTSLGDYECEPRNGEHNVSAEISSIWEITPFGNRDAGGISKWFSLTGKASTVARIIRHDPHAKVEIAMWRMEIGDDGAPGCRFHVQIMGEHDHPPFPHSLSVPRLPTIIFTPMAVIEFVIGELFQDDWRREGSRDTPAIHEWRQIQQRRFQKLFEWHSTVLATSTASPWLALKLAAVDRDLFAK